MEIKFSTFGQSLGARRLGAKIREEIEDELSNDNFVTFTNANAEIKSIIKFVFEEDLKI